MTDNPKVGLDPNGAALVIGDWFVDEHWACGVHRSSSSSRTGKGHFRLLSNTRTCVQSFCGAGRTASLLLNVRQGDEHFFRQIVGVGFWHRKDTKSLRSLFNYGNAPNTHFRLKKPKGKPVGNIKLLNLNKSLHRKSKKRERFEYTTQIIRVYRKGQQDRLRFERFDWELPLREPDWSVAKLKHLEGQIRKKLNGQRLRMIVIKDLLKGAINRDIIECLCSMADDKTRWYVSSKKWMPEWLDVFENVDLRLLLVPQVAAKEAIQSKKLTRWLYQSGRPSIEALELIEELDEITGKDSEDKQIVVLPDGFSLIGRWRYRDEKKKVIQDKLVIQSETEPEEILVPMGGASIFFPTLITSIESAETRELLPKETLCRVIESTVNWVKCDGNQVLDPENWTPDPHRWDGGPAILNLEEFNNRSVEFGDFYANDWQDEVDDWDTSLTNLGIVETNKRKQLQLWRSTMEVDNYVAFTREKRESLRSLVLGVNSFVQDPKHNVGCLLIGSPGSGKTFLVRQLAQSAGIDFLPFNITQMSSNADLLNSFDTIKARQDKHDKLLLVFVDEINAEINGNVVYGTFLAPLEDATYIRNGQTHHLRPCVWIFSGTKPPVSESKGSDFASRLSLGTINIDTEDNEIDLSVLDPELDEFRSRRSLTKLEKVYLGVSILKNEFRDVSRVSRRVLEVFESLKWNTSIRDIKHFVKRFKDIQYGRVMSHNVPASWPGENGTEVYDEWQKENPSAVEEEKEMIEIVS